MEVFHKFYTRLQPIVDRELKSGNVPNGAAGTLMEIARQLVFEASRVYTKDIMKDKFGLNIDLSDRHCIKHTGDEEIDPTPFFLQNISPCEICGCVRVNHKCHIIPRAFGGFDTPDNILVLCANHHYLFDNHRLTQDEWSAINWEGKDPRVIEFAHEIHYRANQMYWKYNYPIVSCDCGSQDFEVTYFEKKPVTRDGGIEVYPGQVVKKLLCKKCGDYYADSVFKQTEYEWWRQYVISISSMGGEK